jgi:error-prone DNA polymerase
MELLFERFLSEERGEWPDIDLDLPSGDRRERVIQHVYEKYGQRGAAMTANVITYRGKSAAREVGKALSLDEARIESAREGDAQLRVHRPQRNTGAQHGSAGLSMDMPRVRAFAELWMSIQDLPRHLGQHSGGMVVSQGELDPSCRSSPPACPGASSFSGTRTTAPRWGSSRSICSASA